MCVGESVLEFEKPKMNRKNEAKNARTRKERNGEKKFEMNKERIRQWASYVTAPEGNEPGRSKNNELRRP